MKKKFMALILGVTLILFFAACTKNADSDSSAVKSSISSDDKTSETKTEATESKSQSGDVLVDNEYCKIIFNNIDYTHDDVRMNLTVQNKTDKALNVTLDNFALDGVMSFASDEHKYEANQTEDIICFIGYDYLTLDCKLENKDFSIVEFNVKFRDDEDYTVLYEDTLTLYPLGEDAAQKKVYAPADTDVVLLDNDVCKISFLKGKYDEATYYVYLYIENKTNETLSFEFPKGKVNGISTSVTDSVPQVTAKNAMYYTPSFWCLEEDGISEVKTIEMPVVAYSLNDFTKPAVDETFTITP